MTQLGGKRRANKTLKSWVAFVKKVQKEENLTYPKAMKRASQRKKEWKRGMKGGEPYDDDMTPYGDEDSGDKEKTTSSSESETIEDALGGPIAEIDTETTTTEDDLEGGRRRRRRRTRRHHGGSRRSRSHNRTARRSRSRGRGRGRGRSRGRY